MMDGGAPPETGQQHSFHHPSDLGFVDEKLMGAEVFASFEEEIRFLGGGFGDIEDMKLPGEIAGDGNTENINSGGLLEFRVGQEKGTGDCVDLAWI